MSNTKKYYIQNDVITEIKSPENDNFGCRRKKTGNFAGRKIPVDLKS